MLQAADAPPVVLASRGDPLTPYLRAALGRRYRLGPTLDAGLGRVERGLVAASTFRPARRAWAERYYKSALARRLRSRGVARQLDTLPVPPATVLQVHGLFDVVRSGTLLYVDVTHRQSAQFWPAWNPLSGKALQRWYDRETEQYHRAFHVFAFSEPTRASLVDDYGVPEQRVTVVGAGPNFDEIPVTSPVSRRPGPPTILFVGNDFVRKGGRVLLEAFRSVRERLPGARLQIVTDEPGIAPAPGVELLGRIGDRQRLSGLYAAAHVFALPSIFEPFGLVLLEAMAHGTPVVASRSCGLPEVVPDGRAGDLVDAGDVPGLAAALVALLGDQARADRFGEAGRQRVRTELSWDRVVDRMAPVLDDLVTNAVVRR